VALTLAAVVVVATALLVSRTGGGPGSATPPSTTSRAPTTTSTAPATTTTVPPTTTTVDPGTLPQTDTLPPANDPQLQSEVGALWQGVVAGSVGPALPAYFPESAYLQLKDLPNATADYRERLIGDFGEDVDAAHALLGADAASATLVGVDVPESYAHWIPPGVCYNGIGYWEVPNARVVYQEDGQTRSFGIASMISWRGEWYVVHFGAVLESGVVDDPEPGAGTSTPSSTC
jgi:hypothetical protein